MVDESWSLEAVGGCTGIFYTVGHTRWTTREYTNLRKEDVLFLEAVEELVEVRTAKVSHRAQTSEETATRQLLEVPLADVLQKEMKILHPTLQGSAE